jgi:hypothetical protein
MSKLKTSWLLIRTIAMQCVGGLGALLGVPAIPAIVLGGICGYFGVKWLVYSLEQTR